MTQIREGGVEIPAGMKLVPIEPTEAMLYEGVEQLFGWAHDDPNVDARLIYRAMLAAYTPTPSPEMAEQPETVEDPFDDCLGVHVQANAKRLASHPTPAGASMPDDAVERYFPREVVARLMLLEMYGFEFEGESLCDDAERIFSTPSPRAVNAVRVADAIADLLATTAPDAAKREGVA